MLQSYLPYLKIYDSRPEISALKQELSNQQQEINMLKSDISTLTVAITTLTVTISTLATTIQQIEAGLILQVCNSFRVSACPLQQEAFKDVDG
jgi:chromosome segregation ATPase